MEPAEVNEDFFKKVYPTENIETEEAFREKLRSEAKDYFQRESDNFFVHEVMEKLTHETEIDLPAEFIKRWLVQTEEKVTEDSVDKDYEDYEGALKQQLIVNKIASDFDIKVEQEDIRNHIKHMYGKQFGFDPADEEKSKQLDPLVDSIMQNQEEVKKMYDQLFDEKVREVFKSELKLKKTVIGYDDFIKKVNEHHKHHHEHE